MPLAYWREETVSILNRYVGPAADKLVGGYDMTQMALTQGRVEQKNRISATEFL